MKRSLGDAKRAVELAARPLTLIAISWLLDKKGTEAVLPRKGKK